MRRQKNKKINILYRLINRETGIVSYLPENTISILSNSANEIIKYDVDYETQYVYNQRKSDYELYKSPATDTKTSTKRTAIASETVENIKNQITGN